MVKSIISTLLIVIGISLYAQENPALIRKEISTSSAEQKRIKQAIRLGDKYYKDGLYDAALQQYMKLYGIKNDYSPLNYKIAVSHLYGVNPKSALEYFDRANPEVAPDYYCLKGIALIYQKQYDEAKTTFKQYIESLPVKKAKREKAKVDRFVAISDFSAKAVQDSLPVFILNAGPMVNSYYDDYSAVELLSPSPSLYFTTRRPKNDDADIASHSVFNERVLYSPEFKNAQASEAQEAPLKSGRHTSVAGASSDAGALMYYRGKNRFGDVYSVQFDDKKGKPTNEKRLNNKISKKSTNDGTISFTESGDAYFISNRFGGEGGKDIWYAKKKGKKNFYKPQNLKNLNTPLNEECVFVTPDGNTLYYSTNGLPGMGGYDVYKSVKKENGSWSDPANMGYPINSPDDDLFYRQTSDTTLALFTSKRSGGFGGLDVYYIKKDLRIPFELSGNVTDVKTGQTLPATIRLFDRANDMPVGTALNDTLLQRYVLNMDDIGDYYLQAEAPGYRSSQMEDFVNPTKRHSKLQQNFELEKLLHPYTLNGYVTDVRTGKPVQAEIIIKPTGKEDVLIRTVSSGASGFFSLTMEDKDDIDILLRATDYFDHNESMPLKNVAESAGSKNFTLQRSKIIYSVAGIITSEDATPIKANISVNKVSDDQFVQDISSEENGKYELILNEPGPFLLEITSEGHFFANHVLQFHEDSMLIIRNFALKKMEVGVKIVIDNILFNTGASSLRPESFAALNKLVNLLRENPNVRIEVAGHTDNTGSATTNKTLSKNRALTVRNYLISQGIVGERVEYNGYGPDRPIAPNNTEEGRAANRRVEIEILN